eukprot:TRINITY_DN4685_c0_g1_i17.p1 TRINITY_DN4685_c0_g1~~TRINITY_DN4685_c0_g1_i17.p1  ORF type:complete len:297 (-),score=69.13 TRINITY_DN4685_c0_g1_i17:278-1168(-)
MEDSFVSDKVTNESREYGQLLLEHLKLLCELDQKQVLPVLKKKYYPVQESIDICSSHKFLPGVAYLLRLSGDLTKSFETYLEIIDRGIRKLLKDPATQDLAKDFGECQDNFEAAIKVCEENSELAVNEKAGEDLWFRLLDHIYNAFIKCKESGEGVKAITEFVSKCTNSLLNTMINSVSFPNLLTCMAERYGELKIENLKDMFNKMLFSYMYQEKILQTAKVVSSKNIKREFESMYKLRCRGSPITQGECSRCERPIDAKEKLTLAVYPCGHLYHRACARTKMCFVCTHKEISKVA